MVLALSCASGITFAGQPARTSAPGRASRPFLHFARAFRSSREKTPTSFFVLFPFSCGKFASLCFRYMFSFITFKLSQRQLLSNLFYLCLRHLLISILGFTGDLPQHDRRTHGGRQSASWTVPAGLPSTFALTRCSSSRPPHVGPPTRCPGVAAPPSPLRPTWAAAERILRLAPYSCWGAVWEGGIFSLTWAHRVPAVWAGVERHPWRLEWTWGAREGAMWVVEGGRDFPQRFITERWRREWEAGRRTPVECVCVPKSGRERRT